MAGLSVAEAAATLGISVDTVRRRIKRGELETTKARDGRLVVLVDVAAAPDRDSGTGTHESGDVAQLRADLAQALAVLEETQRHRDDLADMVSTLREEVSALHRQIEAAQHAQQRSDDAQHELRVLLGQAQAQLGNLLPPPSSTAQQGESRPFWRFWRR